MLRTVFGLMVLMLLVTAAPALEWGDGAPALVDTRAPSIELLWPQAGDTLRPDGPVVLQWRVHEDSLELDDPPSIPPIVVQLFDGGLLVGEWAPGAHLGTDYSLQFEALWPILTLEARWAVSVVDFVGNAATDTSGVFAVFGSGVSAPPPPLSGQIALAGHPNPFNPRCELSFELPSTMPTRLSIHDPSGREVVRLLDGIVEAGQHSLIWDASGVGSGVYLALLSTPGGRRSAKLLLLK